ncbi:hypothetical protein AXE80_03360 [Wenyingzhuangia fucanilytica]|uniref:Sialate O-acetylesterase domain-containing protein n=1 Tax=Wenyingzhuangia fucanilytica TaxID=1790137 RepID=A0A1B1Y3M4_9FLAO|nr:sialate O-acetylesterase [Wenyingzhuangia fucanilytica]ANW95375.1 hypothetical protein AXE80_03360 [Wenyingzhuangia fucanilytica]
MKNIKGLGLYVLMMTFFINSFVVFGSNQSHTSGFKVAKVFGDHMVLQQNKPIRIWGSAKVGTKISAKFDDEEKEIITNKDGEWLLTFKARKASFKPHLLKINNIIFKDILIGEVWICSGQSNMYFPLKNIDTYRQQIKEIDNNSIRIFKNEKIRTVAKNGYTEEELKRCQTDTFFKATWKVSAKESAEKTSAIAWLFANGLTKKINAPVGIIQVAVGGSAINNWIPSKALKSNSLTQHYFDKDWLKNDKVKAAHRQRAKDAFKNVLIENQPYYVGKFPYRWLCEPSFLFEAGIAPLKNMFFKGVLWYQGESDTDNLEMVNMTKKLFPMMINEWRTFFNQGDFPFIAVQLPAFKGTLWPEFREVQKQTINNVKNSYMVVSFDLGDENNIHPKDKQLIGERAVRLALKNVYSKTKMAGFPELKKWKVKRENIKLTFKEIGEGVHIKNDIITGFEVADKEGNFHKAIAVLSSKKSIKVISPIKEPVKLRYGWMPFPKPPVSVYNSEALPLGPFQLNLN